MIKINRNGLTYYQFEILNRLNIKHGVFTRAGGVSPVPFDSLNLGSTTGDMNANVAVNRKRIFETLNLPVSSIFDVWQVHGKEIIIAEQPRNLSEAHQKADGILTDKPGISLFMRFADCVPVILYDPRKRVIGLVHAGWQGTVKRIVQGAVEAMKSSFDTHPADILAGIGPSICVDHYEIGSEVVAHVNRSLPEIKDEIIYNRGNAQHFDLWKANTLLLSQVGVTTIEQSEYCTAANTHEWYSHRAEGAKSGRFAVLISLDEP